MSTLTQTQTEKVNSMSTLTQTKKVNSTSTLTPIIKNHELEKALAFLGLNLTQAELTECAIGNPIYLEHKELSEVGSIFILAAALSSAYFQEKNKKIKFQDLQKPVNQSSYCSGIPLYCWREISEIENCIYLTFLDGKPAIRTCRCPHLRPCS